MRRLPRLLFALTALFCAATASAGYTKIANSGIDLPADAALGSGPNDWACTRDDDSGLIWEVKTSAVGWRNVTNSYTNYDSNYGTAEQINAASNTLGFVNAVNTAALCGYTGWRMPSKDELLALYPKIVSGYFPNTQSTSYWSGSLHFSGANYAWYVNFTNGSASENWRTAYYPVRLVRDAQFFALSVTVTGGGTGSITADGIDCQRANGTTLGTCAMERGNGATVSLTATAAAGSSFSGWSGACSGSSPTCTVTMTEAKAVTASFAQPFPTRSILIDPAAPTTLYAGLDGAGVYKKVDAGNWVASNSGLSNLNVIDLAIKADGVLYAGTDSGGVFKSTDSGSSWSACANTGTGMTNLNIRSLALAGNTLYAGTTDGIFSSSDDCSTWTVMNAGLPN